MLPEIAGVLMTLLFAVCYIPQLWKTWRCKRVDDLGIGLWYLALAGYFCAFVYISALKYFTYILLANFSICTVLCILQVMMYHWYKGKK